MVSCVWAARTVAYANKQELEQAIFRCHHAQPVESDTPPAPPVPPRYFSRYKFELRLPFSRQRCSLEISSALHRSSKARLTVERDMIDTALTESQVKQTRI